MMRIGFDGAVLTRGPATGVALSFLWTLDRYLELTDHDAIVVMPKGGHPPNLLTELADRHDTLTIHRSNAVSGFLRRALHLPRAIESLGVNLWHSPVTAVPIRSPVPSIATVHDLPWRAADPLGEGPYRRARSAIRVASRAADALIVPSQSTARDLSAEVCGCDDRIRICPLGVPAAPARGEDATGPFVVLGDDRPRKNLARLRNAHAKARQIEPKLPDLIEIGPHARYVDEPEKDALLRRATALIHASLHEGFGLPVLEAFTRAVPVLCSDRASLAELAAGAALIVDPTDEDAIAEGMVQLFRDDALREQLAGSGLERAREFSLDATAACWLEVHRSLVPPRPPGGMR